MACGKPLVLQVPLYGAVALYCDLGVGHKGRCGARPPVDLPIRYLPDAKPRITWVSR